jgi:hypothetical protein
LVRNSSKLATDQNNNFTSSWFETQSELSVTTYILIISAVPEVPIGQDTEEITSRDGSIIDNKSEIQMYQSPRGSFKQGRHIFVQTSK